MFFITENAGGILCDGNVFPGVEGYLISNHHHGSLGEFTPLITPAVVLDFFNSLTVRLLACNRYFEHAETNLTPS